MLNLRIPPRKELVKHLEEVEEVGKTCSLFLGVLNCEGRSGGQGYMYTRRRASEERAVEEKEEKGSSDAGGRETVMAMVQVMMCCEQ